MVMNKKILIALALILWSPNSFSIVGFFKAWAEFNVINCKAVCGVDTPVNREHALEDSSPKFRNSANSANSASNNAPDKPDFSFADIAGSVPDDVRELVDFVKNVEQYKKVGAKMPKGILLHGPGGTGKTSLARAIAGEANAAFFNASGSEFIEMYVGVGPQRVRELFNAARAAVKSKKYKRAIIFIDEIDAIGCSRTGESNSEYRNTLNELLNQMDGFALEDSIFIIGATNTIQLLDKALLRPGRFDRLVKIDLPALEDRIAILKHYAHKIACHVPLTLFNDIATQTAGFSPAELKALVNEAAVFAARGHKSKVDVDDFNRALEKMIAQHRQR